MVWLKLGPERLKCREFWVFIAGKPGMPRREHLCVDLRAPHVMQGLPLFGDARQKWLLPNAGNSTDKLFNFVNILPIVTGYWYSVSGFAGLAYLS